VNDPVKAASRIPDSEQTSQDVDATAVSVETSISVSEHNLGSIGPYYLITKLGEGGMGTVWLAEQLAPVHRRVAIKVVKSGRFSDQALRRFDLERQSLAIMNHPAIAKVFDAGSTSDGQPYFVMEYASGLPITNYCNQKRLGTRERIELMIKVCEGVQHAHQNAIIHRDLKPSNILVTEVDGKPLPRVIDFGIAKAMQAKGAEGDTIASFTQAGGMIGTPGYMSPEQADPAILDVDTRSDVYSLGVVLYQLLTSSLPFDPKQWHIKPLHEVLRQMQEEDPQAPSTRVSTNSSEAAANSGTEAHKLISVLRGDLDWITLKALERDRERRYSSPSELAADLNRFLQNEPIVARPPSFTYRAQKFVRRNRLAVAFSAAMVLLIVGFAISMIIERNRARREAETAQRVSDFMTGMFKVSDPGESRGNSVTAREILDKASTQIEKGLGQDPHVQARLMQTMGSTYHQLGLNKEANNLLEQAVAVQARVLGPENPETLRSKAILGTVVKAQGRASEAEKLLRQTLASQQRVLGPDHLETMQTVSYLTDTLNGAGQFAEAEGLIRRTLANQQKKLGPEDPATLRSMRSLTQNLNDQGRLAEAEKLGQETIALERKALGPDHPGTLWSMNQLALTYQDDKRYPEAEKLFRETYAASMRVLGPDHTNTRAALSNIGLTLQLQGKYAEAEVIQREELQRTSKLEGPEHPDTLDSMNNLGITLGKQGKFQESERLLRNTLEIEIRTLGLSSPNTRHTMGNLASTLAYEKREAEALALFEKMLAASAKTEGTELMDAHYQYAGGLVILGHLDEAFKQLEQAVKLGFENKDQLMNEADLKPLQSDSRFPTLLEQIEKNKTTASK
jgi:serine/threonine protein kinase/tetratricopeptide (TPR) repeat protein